MNFWFIRQPCFIILSLFPQNISILTESSKSSAEVAKNDLGTKNKNTDFLAELLPFTIILDMQYDLIKKNFPFLSLFHMQYQLLQFLYRHNIFY